MSEHILQNIASMTHPVIFQNFNLCEKRSKGLGMYGEKKLTSMVEAYELSPDGTHKKLLLDCLKEYLQLCPCYKINEYGQDRDPISSK